MGVVKADVGPGVGVCREKASNECCGRGGTRKSRARCGRRIFGHGMGAFWAWCGRGRDEDQQQQVPFVGFGCTRTQPAGCEASRLLNLLESDPRT